MEPTIVKCDVCGKRNRVPPAAEGVSRCGNCHAPLPWVVDADDTNFHDIAERARIPVLVDLWAPWCGPCRMVSPALERLAHEYAGRVKLVKVNVDQAPRTSQHFDVRGIPTLLVLLRGDMIARQTGAFPEQQLREWLDQALASAAETAAPG